MNQNEDIFDESDLDGVMFAEINITPLVDVMLVLLIVFIITIPVLTRSLDVKLPMTAASPNRLSVTANTIHLSITANGLFLVDKRVVDGQQLTTMLRSRCREVGTPLTLKIYADQQVPYAYVAQALSTAQAVDITNIEFAVEPSATDHPK